MLNILPLIEDQEQPSNNVFPSNQSIRSFTQAWILFAQKKKIHVWEKEHFQEKKINNIVIVLEREQQQHNNLVYKGS